MEPAGHLSPTSRPAKTTRVQFVRGSFKKGLLKMNPQNLFWIWLGLGFYALVSSMLAGQLIEWKRAWPLLAVCGLLSAGVASCYWSNAEDSQRLLLCLPTIVFTGMAAGSAVKVFVNDRQQKARAEEAADWVKLAIDAEAGGLFHVYLKCTEKAGDLFMEAAMPREALQHYNAAWTKQLRKHPVHSSMTELGTKLIDAMKRCGGTAPAADIAASLEQARISADEILEDEIWVTTPLTSPAR